MMPADWTIKQGDTQPAFADTLQFADGTVPPLHGATVVLQLRSLLNASVTQLAGAVTITNPNTGDVLFTPTAADTSVAGNYFAEWIVTYAVSTGLGQQTFPTDGYNWLSVEPSLGSIGQGIIDVPAIKKYLNIQANDRTRDAELIELASAVTFLVEAEVGPVVPTTYAEYHDGGSEIITLDRDPSQGFGSNPHLKVIGASEYRGPIEYPLALVPSPAFGSIYSVMISATRATITRRTAGGRTIAFMPGRDSVHVWYQAGQDPIPVLLQQAAKEYIRNLYRWPQQTGAGSLSPADRMEAGAILQQELSRIVRMWLRPMRRYPSIA
jgi:hypothetical protein